MSVYGHLRVMEQWYVDSAYLPTYPLNMALIRRQRACLLRRDASKRARKKALQHVLQGLQTLVGAAGFELATLCSQSRCATRLRYAPTARILTRQISCFGFNACFFDFF